MIVEIILKCNEDEERHLKINSSLLNDEQCYVSFGDDKEEEQFIVWLSIADLKKAIDKLAL
jgi:hypothetical protein